MMANLVTKAKLLISYVLIQAQKIVQFLQTFHILKNKDMKLALSSQ